jgi:hypothetical protein
VLPNIYGGGQFVPVNWDPPPATDLKALDKRRWTLGSALAREALGDNEGAYAVPKQAVDEAASFEVRGMVLVSRGILADRPGRRDVVVG